MKPRIVLPRRAERRISFLYGPPYPSEAGWVWVDRRAHIERRSRHSGVERRACLREEELFRILFEAAPEAALVLDIRGTVVVANRRCEGLFGYLRDELVGVPAEILLPERHRDIYSRHRERYGAEPCFLRLESELSRRDGCEFPVEICLNPVETPQRQLLFAMVRDIGEQRRTIERLRRELRDLAQAKAGLEADLRALWLTPGGR